MALVITIAIIIILATITISTVFDDNGIVPYAERAKLETEISADKEQLQMIYAELYLKRTTEEHRVGNIEASEYLSFLEEKGIATKEEEGKSYASVNNKIYEIIMENGNLAVEYVEEGEITEPRIQSIIIISQTPNSIGIRVEATRMEGGTYYYSIGTSEDAMGQETSSQEATYTFEGLTQGNT